MLKFSRPCSVLVRFLSARVKQRERERVRERETKTERETEKGEKLKDSKDKDLKGYKNEMTGKQNVIQMEEFIGGFTLMEWRQAQRDTETERERDRERERERNTHGKETNMCRGRERER